MNSLLNIFKYNLKIMIDPTDCKNLKEEEAIKCHICLEIHRYQLIFPCGHLECHNCYSSDFTQRARRCKLKFFTKCPVCRSDVIPEKVSTAEMEFKLRPTSKVSIFYKNSVCAAASVDVIGLFVIHFWLYTKYLNVLNKILRHQSLACILIKKISILLLTKLSLTAVEFPLVYLVTSH